MSLFRIGGAVSLAVASVAWQAAAAAPPAAYEFKPGQTATYQVDVTIEEDDLLHTMSGSPSYTVESVKDGTAVIRFSGWLQESVKSTKPNTFVMPGPPRSAFSGFSGLSAGFGRGVSLTLNQRGEIVKVEGSSQLPYLLGNLHEMILVPLPAKPQDRWKTQTDMQITVVSSLFPRPRLPRGFPSPPRIGGPTSEETLNASETTTYAASNGKEARRTYKLGTKEEVEGKPRVELSSQGMVAFADDGFLPSKLDWKGELVMRKDGDVGTRPISVSIRRLTEAEIKERAKQAEIAKAEAAEKLQGDLGSLVSDLESNDSGKARAAALRLNSAEAGEGNAEVAKALAKAMEKAEQKERWFFSQALAKWATPDQSDLLIALLEDEHLVSRHRAMDLLSQRKVEAAIPAIADRLEVSIDRLKASAALKAIGSPAAEATAKKLESGEWIVRLEAVQVLKEIGTAKELDALKTTSTSDENNLVKIRAQDAIKTIESRGK